MNNVGVEDITSEGLICPGRLFGLRNAFMSSRMMAHFMIPKHGLLFWSSVNQAIFCQTC